MPQPDIYALKAWLLGAQLAYIADSVAQALEDAEAEGSALSFREHGMREPTAYGQRVEDEAANNAAQIFTKILDGYLQKLTSFTPSSGYDNAVDYAVNQYHGAQSEAEQDALERIIAAHDSFLHSSAHAQFLLQAPLEFADFNTQDLLSPQDQQAFSQILGKLRCLAAS